MATTTAGESLPNYYQTAAALMPLCRCQDIEGGKNPNCSIHIAAARWALTGRAFKSPTRSGFMSSESAIIVKEAAK
jgi:hypothetical protein